MSNKIQELRFTAMNDRGETVKLTIRQWSDITGKNKDKIRHHIYLQKERGYSDREVVGLDEAPNWASKKAQETQRIKREAKARETINAYLTGRFLSKRLV